MVEGYWRLSMRFAEAGFTQQYVSDLERGRRNPTVVTLFISPPLSASATLILCSRMMRRHERPKTLKRNA